MKELVAMNLERFPVTGLIHVRDLIYFEGPLLSQFKHENGENYLYYWCDCDEEANRWMVLRVSEATLLRLTERILALGEVIPCGSRDDFVYFLDMFSDGSVKSYLAMPEAIPEDYQPAPSTFLEPLEPSPDTHSCSFLLEGEWSVEAIGNFPKVFNKVYSVMYGLSGDQSRGFMTHPWRGGFSSLHFFREITAAVPRRDRPYVEAIQKFSPGFVRFSLNTQAAEQAIRCVTDFRASELIIEEHAKLLRQFIKYEGLNDIEDESSQEWEKVNNSLDALTRRLLSHFTIFNVDRFMEMSARKFEAAKISLSFVKYVRRVLDFEKKGLIVFPKSR